MALNFIAHYWVKTTDVVMFIDANSVMYIIMVNHHDNTIIINIIIYWPLSCALDYSDNILLSPNALYMYIHEKSSFLWLHEKLLTQNLCMKEKKLFVQSMAMKTQKVLHILLSDDVTVKHFPFKSVYIIIQYCIIHSFASLR